MKKKLCLTHYLSSLSSFASLWQCAFSGIGFWSETFVSTWRPDQIYGKLNDFAYFCCATIINVFHKIATVKLIHCNHSAHSGKFTHWRYLYQLVLQTKPALYPNQQLTHKSRKSWGFRVPVCCCCCSVLLCSRKLTMISKGNTSFHHVTTWWKMSMATISASQ